MTVAYCSDTHLDFWCRETNTQNPKFKKQLKQYLDNVLLIEKKDADVIIVAGDIGHYFKQDTEFLLELRKFYKHVIVTYGNHDMYLVSKSIQSKYMHDSMNRVREMKRWCAEQDNIHFLDGNSVVIDGVCFAGSSMMWDISYAESLHPGISMGEVLGHWENIMNDANLIFQDGRRQVRIPTAYGGSYTEPSFKPLEHWEKQRTKLDNIEYCDIMISHYGPKIPDNLLERYKDITTTFYYFDGLEDIERLGCKKWIFGHTHVSIDEMYKQCNLLCNPIGYPGENTYNTIQVFDI